MSDGKCPKACGPKILPLGDRVVLKVIEQDDKSSGGILLVETAKEQPQKGKVIAVGDGVILENGTKVPLTVKVDDIVVYQKYAGTELKFGESKYLIVREEEIVGILQEEK